MTTKKTVTKRVGGAVKKNHKKSKRVLARAVGEQCFWTSNGPILSTLVELRDLFATINDASFKYHVSRTKNDFADWVQFVLGDAELAKALRTTKKPKTARTHVVRRLKIYDI